MNINSKFLFIGFFVISTPLLFLGIMSFSEMLKTEFGNVANYPFGTENGFMFASKQAYSSYKFLWAFIYLQGFIAASLLAYYKKFPFAYLLVISIYAVTLSYFLAYTSFK